MVPMGLSPGPRHSRDPVPHEEVRRPQLEARLDGVGPGGLALLSASAGSGKSVLVRQWLDHRPALRTAVLGLTNRHDDAVTLVRALIGAIRSAAPEVAPVLEGKTAAGGASLGDDLVDSILEGFSVLDTDLVLVLEDLHVLSNRAVLADLGRLAAQLPATTRVVATSRLDPPWRLQRLRLAGRLTEIRSADLAFDVDEAKALLENVARRGLSDEIVRALVERTDGWAVGLQLAAISLRTTPEPETFVASFAGSDRLVAEYLLDEVIDQQEPEVQRFLLQTCVLDRMTADLCDAVTGVGNARLMLDELYRRSMFLIPLDAAATTFRYHHLFAEVLRYRLGIEGGGQVSELNRRAAQWLIKHGEEERGIGHLIQAQENDEAVRVIATMGHRLFERGESATLVRWLTLLNARDPGGSVDAMINLLAAQFGADEADAATETYRRIMRRPDLSDGERIVAQTLYSLQVWRGLAPETIVELTDEVREALPRLGPDEIVDFLGLGGRESLRVMNEHSAALAHFFLGDLERAAAILEHSRTLSGVAYPLWRIYLLGSLALVRAWQGHATDAMGIAQTAVDAAEAFGVSHHQASVCAHLALAFVHLDRVELEAGEASLAQARPRILARPASRAYFDLHSALEAWLSALGQGPDPALELLRAPSATGTEALVLREGRRTFRIRLLIGTGNVAGAQALLDGAPETPALPSARVDVLLARGDVREARAALDAWTPPTDDLRETVRRHLRSFAVLEAEGDARAGRASLERAVAAARGDRLRWPFLEVPASLQALRRRPLPDSSWLTSEALWGAAAALHPRIGAQDTLAEPLSQRELDVLAYLPGRMRNQEIAADLFVSVNTVKTHVASIYRKLGVTERDDAVKRATQLGLI
jgi:LuxR family maltose regulon positive regulatory protein